MISMKQMIRISLFAAMISVSVYLFPPFLVPYVNITFTLQTLLVVLIGFLLKPSEAFLSCFIYLLLGAAGLPVFSGAQGGFQIIVGPTGGFLILFPFLALGISLLKSKTKKMWFDLLISILLAIPLLYLLANIWLSYSLSINYWRALLSLIPFVPFDILKIGFAYLIYQKIPDEVLY
ncbi:MAG: biotin transporter BioY [Bacillota bacterium]|nr:MAG: biotin transporter BioY [Bacillota bacterium]